MINFPPIDEMANKVGSKYALCVICSKRARELLANAGNPSGFEMPDKQKPLTAAAYEVYNGKVTVAK
ncbi:MAG TPA: DNA-directed RNA polymerase subunit omega [Clostridiales bacterium]|mgnify:CR=1 FL=1|nr:DNA-directed RNA polymerase subunit omega [Clostridiales bacterium]HBJ97803.1 DNA-directed RNA polymerase subunit omega [Clostridiales bacterium]